MTYGYGTVGQAIGGGYDNTAAQVQGPTLRGLAERFGELHELADQINSILCDLAGVDAPSAEQAGKLHPVPTGLVGELHDSVGFLRNKLQGARDKLARGARIAPRGIG